MEILNDATWYRGNLHTHTLNSDGDSSSSVVARWYRDHGYDFLVLTDHNHNTPVEELQAELDHEHRAHGKSRLLLIPGEELTNHFHDGTRGYDLHVNGLGTRRTLGAQTGRSVSDLLQRCVDAVHGEGGLPSLNHPNFRWAVTLANLLDLRGMRHLEIYNGHPEVNNLGGGGAPSNENLWDGMLSRGVEVFGIAVDDAHVFQHFGAHLANPGRGWVVVQCAGLERNSILAALEMGRFYASTGVTLEHVSRDGGCLSLATTPVLDTRYRTEFIGAEGRVLAATEGLAAEYLVGDDDVYVRARVMSSQGMQAWTQPVRSPA
jgi:hypothetical protein